MCQAFMKGFERMFADKFDLTLEQNVFLAKKNLVQVIHNSARLEGCNITYPETKTILDGVSVVGLSMDDVQCVVNLRNAWRYSLNHINEPMTLEMMNHVNAHVFYLHYLSIMDKNAVISYAINITKNWNLDFRHSF